MSALTLIPGQTPLAELHKACQGPVSIKLDAQYLKNVERAKQTVDQLCADHEPVYGINTGFGKLASQKIEDDHLQELQHNLLLSHSCGVGARLQDHTVRLVLVLKVLSLARGYSGVRPMLLECLMALVNADVLPCVPEKGSVGASGDLAPLAHLSAVLIGVGEVRHQNKTLKAKDGLKIAGLKPLKLAAKEGLALINGTQVSTALALESLFRGFNVFRAALVAGALSVDAMKGSDAPFDQKIHELRGHPGQIQVAKIFRTLMQGSSIRASHLDCEKVQDPYSLRCQPQVMGAILDSLLYAAQVLSTEANAVTDNPLIFPEDNTALSGGNFHAEPVALVADQLAVALSEIGAIAERRVANLVDPDLSLLPPFLVEDAGINSGFMIAQVTAAALASENKSLAHPAGVDSLPTSANQEDHVSMATFAARRLKDIVDNLVSIIAIELLAATQAIEFHRPKQSSDTLEQVIGKVRQRVARYEKDRHFAPDLEQAQHMIESGIVADYCPDNWI